MGKLTAKQQRFVEEYLVDLNATQAAMRAGYSARTAAQVGHENLRKPEVAGAIAAAQSDRAKRTQIDAAWVLTRLASEATADLADLYDEHGDLKPVSEWPMVWRTGLVTAVETARERNGQDAENRPRFVEVRKVKAIDRSRIVELIGKHVGVGAFRERIEHTGKDGGPVQVEDLSPTDIARRICFVLMQGVKSQASAPNAPTAHSAHD